MILAAAAFSKVRSHEGSTAPKWRLADNHLLGRVAASDRPDFEGRLERVILARSQILYEPGDSLTHVYFPTSGMVAMIAVMADGRATETAAIGREGALGISASGYVDPAFCRYAVQIEGAAYRVSAADFEQMVDDSIGLCSAVARWRDVLTRVTLQSVACNILHTVPQRAARWILATQDRTGAAILPITQDALAETLGVKRNVIGRSIAEMQRDGAVATLRGRLSVTNRDKLQATACECYGRLRVEIDRLLADGPSSECDD